MNCHQVLENLSAFIDNELGADQTNAVKAHLIRCSSCRHKRDTMDELSRRIRRLPPITAPQDFQFKVYAGIRKYESRRARRRFWHWQTIAVSGTTLLIGLVIGLSSYSLLNHPAPVPMIADTNHPDIQELPITITVTDDGIIYDYSLDRYIHGSLVPVTVDTIPETADLMGESNRSPLTATENQTYSQSQYVLDNIPMRVNYERTIY